MMIMLALAAAATTPPAPPTGTVPFTLGANNARIDEPMERPAGATMVWSDEFDGDKLDLTHWRYDMSRNHTGWARMDQQFYTSQHRANLQLIDGKLVITGRQETLDKKRFVDYKGQPFTSARIRSVGDGHWQYGYFEIRAMLPCGGGSWPAIWMLPNGPSKWPADGEIDIMEQIGRQAGTVHGTVHTALYNHLKKTQRGAAAPVPTSCTDYHTYQLDWRPDMIRIGVDGRAYVRVLNNIPGGHDVWPFDRPFDLIINLALGGTWPGPVNIDELPQVMKVDYVRVWQVPPPAPGSPTPVAPDPLAPAPSVPG